MVDDVVSAFLNGLACHTYGRRNNGIVYRLSPANTAGVFLKTSVVTLPKRERIGLAPRRTSAEPTEAQHAATRAGGGRTWNDSHMRRRSLHPVIHPP